MLSLCVMSFGRHIWILSLVFLFALVSCAEKDSPVEDSCPIEFSVADFSTEVRGSELTTDNMSSFGVFAALEDNSQHDFEGIEVSELELFMDDVSVTNVDGSWTANPPHYWPILNDKSLSFFAYAPHSEGTGIVATAGWEQGNDAPEKTVKITYTLDPNPAKHVDLCVAQAVLDRVPDMNDDGKPDPVSLAFEHTLASVTFSANYKGNLPEGCFLRIDELVLNNVVNSNTLTYNYIEDGFFEWGSPPSDKVGNYMLNIGSLTLSSNAQLNKTVIPDSQSDPLPEDVYTDFVTANGIIYALPQTINQQGAAVISSIDVTFSYVKNDANRTVIAQFYTSKDLPSSEWEAATKYKYNFTLDVTTASLIHISFVDQGAWIEDWKDSGNSHTDQTIK